VHDLNGSELPLQVSEESSPQYRANLRLHLHYPSDARGKRVLCNGHAHLDVHVSVAILHVVEQQKRTALSTAGIALDAHTVNRLRSAARQCASCGQSTDTEMASYLGDAAAELAQ
jgi:hypothetical protein